MTHDNGNTIHMRTETCERLEFESAEKEMREDGAKEHSKYEPSWQFLFGRFAGGWIAENDSINSRSIPLISEWKKNCILKLLFEFRTQIAIEEEEEENRRKTTTKLQRDNN